jgi:sulfite reductase (NADPH) flavoprotein alpha-component
MYFYFGFGSNINMTSLAAKGVIPISSQPAIMRGWKLRFNVQHFFRIEGGVGNVEYTGDLQDCVLGILHECKDDTLDYLDATEAYGHGYDRIIVDVELQDDAANKAKKQRAYIYVGMESFINNDCLPSKRYLNIILAGAKQSGLDNGYIQQLSEHPIHEGKDYPTYVPPKGEYPVFDERSLAKKPLFTALLGSVFDMTNARPQHEYLKGFFGGQDMTLFHLKRLDSANNQETIEDIKENRLSNAQRTYLNNYLNEYDQEYRYVGRFSY